jgi:hypothetical protein
VAEKQFARREQGVTKRNVIIGMGVIFGLMAGGAQAAGVHGQSQLSETDSFALDEAAAACQGQDFPALMRALAISEAARIRYSAPEITVAANGTSMQVSREDYADFPIGTLDYYWVTRESVAAWEANPDAELDYLDVEFNQSQADQWAVDWQVVRYDGNSSGGDDMGEIIERIGAPGVLSFEPFEGCWRLVEDFRG